MGYGILHIQKFKHYDIAGLEIHNSRLKPSHSNADIDSSRTNKNFWPVPCPSLRSAIKKRLDKRRTTKKLRDDAVVMVNALITASPEFFKDCTEDVQRQYFLDAVKFFQHKYGSDNIVSAVVHLDEATPHMHLSIVPMTKDMRICAKDLFDKKTLQILQDEFHTYVSQRYGLDRGGDGEKRKHLSEREYKIHRKQQEIELQEIDLEQKRQEQIKDFQRILKNDPEKVAKRLKEITNRYEKLIENYKILEEKVLELENENAILKENDVLLHRLVDGLTDTQLEELGRFVGECRLKNARQKFDPMDQTDMTPS